MHVSIDTTWVTFVHLFIFVNMLILLTECPSQCSECTYNTDKTVCKAGMCNKGYGSDANSIGCASKWSVHTIINFNC